MNIILLSKALKNPTKITLGRYSFIAVIVAVLSLPSALFLYAGYQWGLAKGQEHAESLPYLLQGELARQQQKIEDTKRRAGESLNALAARLGGIQAHVIRLDALGKRLVHVAGLGKGEFDFSHPPQQGGPEEPGLTSDAVNVNEFLRSLDSLTQHIEDRSQQLQVLETMLINRNLQQEVTPKGQPVKDGWLSSYFGLRVDPFTGMMAHHNGVDIAGTLGEPVSVVASGVVTWSGERNGYGNMVEVNHGNGYVTRYAHNTENLVAVGDTVRKGQTIARMGSSGRSTGPHLHFEVLYNGSFVNPVKYLTAQN